MKESIPAENNANASSSSPMHRFQPCRVLCEVGFPAAHIVSAAYLRPSRSAWSARTGSSSAKAAAVAPQCPPDPERAAVFASGLDGFVRDRHGFLVSSDSGQRPGQSAEPDHPGEPRRFRELRTDLYPAIDPSTEQVREGLQQAAPTVDERIITRIGFQPPASSA